MERWFNQVKEGVSLMGNVVWTTELINILSVLIEGGWLTDDWEEYALGLIKCLKMGKPKVDSESIKHLHDANHSKWIYSFGNCTFELWNMFDYSRVSDRLWLLTYDTIVNDIGIISSSRCLLKEMIDMIWLDTIPFDFVWDRNNIYYDNDVDPCYLQTSFQGAYNEWIREYNNVVYLKFLSDFICNKLGPVIIPIWIDSDKNLISIAFLYSDINNGFVIVKWLPETSEELQIRANYENISSIARLIPHNIATSTKQKIE